MPIESATPRVGDMMRTSDEIPEQHTPVMSGAVLEMFQCRPGGIYVDCTLGLGGHARAILERIQPGGLLIGLDRDGESLEIARESLKSSAPHTRLLRENFKNLPLVLNNISPGPVDGILLDLGVSSYQLLSAARGFSFQSDGPLDMRMDRSQRPSAADLVNNLPEGELAGIIYRYGEERFARRIASSIAAARKVSPITRCSQLSEIVGRVVRGRSRGDIHPATRTFQALRIAVNRELEGLEEFFTEILPFLKTDGRIVAIAFHSLEDRIVKRAFRRLAGQCVCDRPADLCLCPRRRRIEILTQRARKPSKAEVAENPRSRSARLRAAARVPEDAE